jgi:hypothetical protein
VLFLTFKSLFSPLSLSLFAVSLFVPPPVCCSLLRGGVDDDVDDSYDSFGQLNLRDGENEPETLRVSTEALAVEKRAAKESDRNPDEERRDSRPAASASSSSSRNSVSAARKPPSTSKSKSNAPPQQPQQASQQQPRRKPGRQGRTRYKTASTQNKKRGAARKRAIL